MWPRDAYVGQHVVCVDDDWGGYADQAVTMGCRLPEKPRVYTIRQIAECIDGVGFRLIEIVNPKVARYGKEEPTFCASQFKPLDESRLDVFRRMLKDAPKSKNVVREDAI